MIILHILYKITFKLLKLADRNPFTIQHHQWKNGLFIIIAKNPNYS